MHPIDGSPEIAAAGLALLALWCAVAEDDAVVAQPALRLFEREAAIGFAEAATRLAAIHRERAIAEAPLWLNGRSADGVVLVETSSVAPDRSHLSEAAVREPERVLGWTGLSASTYIQTAPDQLVLACGGPVRLYVRPAALAVLDAGFRFDAPVAWTACEASAEFAREHLPADDLAGADHVLRFGRKRRNGGRFPLAYPGG